MTEVSTQPHGAGASGVAVFSHGGCGRSRRADGGDKHQQKVYSLVFAATLWLL